MSKTEHIKEGLSAEALAKAGYKPSPLGPIPNDWEVKELGKLSEKIGSGITPTGGNKFTRKAEGIS